MKKYAVIVLISFIAVACVNNNNGLSKFQWVSGNWETTKDSIHVFVDWTYSEMQIKGTAYATKGKDTVFFQRIRLESFEDNIFYTIKNPNSITPISYRLTKYENNEATFENMESGFPEHIIYKLLKDSTFYVANEGTQNGVKVKDEFFFKRK